MADPTPDEVHAALAVLAAAEAAREAALVPPPLVAAVEVAPIVVLPAPEPVLPVVEPEVPAAVVAPVVESAVIADVPAPVVAPVPPQAAAALATLVSTYAEFSARLAGLSLVGLSEHDARQLIASQYERLLNAARRQNLIP
jgi:hypothetical protein